MIIQRVLNNNALSCLDERGKEIIVKGKGIAFKASPGDLVEESKIEEKFILANQEVNRQYQEIMVNIPEDCIETGEIIIEMIKENLKHKISDTIYVTLTDHISNLLERTRLGITFDNTLLWDVKRMYKEEYQLGLNAVKVIREKLDIKLENSEANFIALHIVNAELDVEIKDVYVITGMIDNIYRFIKAKFNLTIDEEDINYTRFILHLRFFIERLIHRTEIVEGKNKDLLETMMNKYPVQYECVGEIISIVGKKYQNEVTSDEALYLLIHVIKLTT